MDIKKLSSLTIFFAILMMIYTGFAQYIAPACRIANWTEWELIGLTKIQYENIHTTFMIVFIIAITIHLYYNFRTILSYAKQKTKKFNVFSNEFIMAFLLTIAVFVGTLYEKSPFVEIIDFGENIEVAWEKRIGNPPFTHAELSSLLVFSRKMGFDLDKTKEILIKNNIYFREPQSIAQIAKQNDVSPRFIFELLRKNFDKEIIRVVSFAYVDKALIKDVATVLNMTSEEFLIKINNLGLESKAAQIFSLETVRKEKSPLQIANELGLKKKITNHL